MHPQHLFKLIGGLVLSFACLAATPALAYTIAKPKGDGAVSKDIRAMQQISRGVADIAENANKAIVFLSVYKTVQGVPPGMVDPFEFFFGPRNRRAPQGQPPNQPSERRRGGVGSGFFIDLDKGYILTNNHVVASADEIQLKLANGKTYPGKIVGRDKNTDVAVVQVKEDFPRDGLAQLPLGNSDRIKVGDFVVALGAPFGLEASLSFGVISALGRGSLDITKIGNFIQTDAAINPGNSGGPLLNMSGHVIGVNTAIYSRSGGYNGIGFAVPANMVRDVAEQLINDGFVRRGYLGVYLQPIDDELHEGLGLPNNVRGTLISKISKDGPADRAGLEPGDVITEVDGQSVKESSDVVNTVGLKKPKSRLDLKIFRDGKERKIKVVIGEHPDDGEPTAKPKTDKRRNTPLRPSAR